MSKKLIILAVAAASLCASAQQTNNAKSSFDEFRKGLLDNYKSFREGILADYAKFLDGVWVEYNGFRGHDRDSIPKPATPPVAVPEDTPVMTPAPVAVTPQKPEPVVPAVPEAPVKPSTPKPDAPQTPSKPATPAVPQKPATPQTTKFSYHGIDMQIPAVDLRLMNNVSTPSDFAAQWRALDADPASARLVSDLKELAAEHKFNDFLTYDLVSQFAADHFASVSPSSRTSLVHYIMAHMGYDARLGVNGSGQALLMLPCKQTVYGHMYLVFDNEKYYVFSDPKVNLSTTDNRISTCQLPREAANAAKLDLRLKPIDIPFKAHPFEIKYGDISIKGETNELLMPILYRYPQMPIGDYASSELMPELRASIVAQLREQLAGKDRKAAVNDLLQFVQSGFEYATDGEFHGFEKPYFFEETLFYDKCDCEDRVIFYTYLLWNVLGVENHLLAYPGHESAAVALNDGTTGDAYSYDGKLFLISDPTYIGAKTGMCMPNYRTTSPEIDHIYR